MPKQYYRIILILLTVASGVGALITTPSALYLALLGFNAQGYRAWVWIVFFLSIPLWFIIGAIAGWVLYLHNWLRTSLLAAATPLVAITVGWLLMSSV
jgi:hypothetical protein